MTRILLCLGLCLWAAHAWAAAPDEVRLEEIRQILREQALHAPSEELLAAMTEENLPEILRQIDPAARLFSGRTYAPAGQAFWIGIGAALAMRGEQPVLHIYRGGGAQQAGVPDRSRLLAIDGQAVTGQDAETIAALLRGEAGSTVRLRVAAPGSGEKDFTVRREIFSPLDVELVDLSLHPVVRVREFTAGLTRPALRATVDFLAERGAEDMLVLDLRDAPGGDLYEAFDLAGLFLPAGTPLGAIRGRGGDGLEIRSPSSGSKYSMPLILLIAPETASAAEIFAGILHDHGRARLVGQTTYGKCSSQTDRHLSDGSVLRYTNKEIFFPSGETCSGKGLRPDLEVDSATLDDLGKLTRAALGEVENSTRGAAPHPARDTSLDPFGR